MCLMAALMVGVAGNQLYLDKIKFHELMLSDGIILFFDKGVGDFDLIPGQYSPVRLIIGQDPAALLIPQPALVESQIGKQVFVVNPDNKVETRSVEIDRSYQHQWVIKKGLKKGEKVIVEVTQKVREGMVVGPKPYAKKRNKNG